MRIKRLICLGILVLVYGNCFAQPKRIVTLSAAISETVSALGIGKNIVAVDVTSEYPENIKKLPKVSRNRSISVENIVSFRPDLILVPTGDLSKENVLQLKTLGIRVVQINQEYSTQGALKFIRQIAAATSLTDKGEALANTTARKLESVLAETKHNNKFPKVLFIYARGAGTMNVAGKGSSLDAIIKLAGGKNAIQEFNEFKPYTTEALIKSNPDVILMFDFGVSSLGGKDAILQMPGVQYTNAGKNKKIVDMDGPLLINFSTRLPDAIKALNARIQ